MKRKSSKIDTLASGNRLRMLRKARSEKFKKEFINNGIIDPREIRNLLKQQEETDYHEMGYSNRRYMKEMLRGIRVITEEVATFYSEKLSVSEEWIFYGSLYEHICYIMNPLPQTVSKEDCLRIEIEAQLQGISYNQLQDFIQIAHNLNILKEITPFTNIVHVYDEGEKGQGHLLLMYHLYGKAYSPKTSRLLITQLLKVLNARQMLLLTEESLFLYFIDEIARKLPQESQNLMTLTGGVREVISKLDGEFSLADSLTQAEAIQLLPKLNKACLIAQKEKQNDIKNMICEFGVDATTKEYHAYSQNLMKVITAFENLTRKKATLEEVKNLSQKYISEESLKQAFDYKKNIKDEKIRKQSERILDELLEIIIENKYFVEHTA